MNKYIVTCPECATEPMPCGHDSHGVGLASCCSCFHDDDPTTDEQREGQG